jgi:hypothetical protein
MAFRISLTERNAAVDGFTALFNKGANPSTAGLGFLMERLLLHPLVTEL